MPIDPKIENAVQDSDVFSITPAGERELKGSSTGLGTLELELLVQIDGRASVSRIAARKSGMPTLAIHAALRNLRQKKLIELGREAAPSDAIDIGDFLKTGAFYVAPKSASEHHDEEAEKGTSSLQQQGYYVRIARKAASDRKLAEGQRLTAMIVEDEPHLSKLLRTFLSIEGFETRTAANRAEIMEALRKAPLPDLVLLDVVLPDADGFDVLVKMRQHPALKNIAIVMLTSKATREAVLKGLAGGADGYITKPFEVDVLMKAVRSVLGLASD